MQRIGGMVEDKVIAVAVLWTLAVAGCGGTAPWTQGTPEVLRPYYYQGIGYSRSFDMADRNALIALAADLEGIQVERVTEDSLRLVQTETGEHYVDILTSRGAVRIKGEVPKGAYIAERWHGRSLYWSYALLEKPRQRKAIERLRQEQLRGVSLKALVPGWAQFTKGEHFKAWRILALEGISAIGAVALKVLMDDMLARRDIATRPDDWKWYDVWANRCYWGSMGFGVAGVMVYMYSLIDGLTSEAKTYRLLMYAK